MNPLPYLIAIALFLLAALLFSPGWALGASVASVAGVVRVWRITKTTL